MAILTNQGTLLYTPAGGTQSSVSSNITTTELTVSYGLEVSHAAAPVTFVTGNEILYTVLLRNIGTGSLYSPTVSVDAGEGNLDYVEGSAAAFLYAGGEVTPVAVTVTENSPLTFTLDAVLPAGGFIYLVYRSTVVSSTAESILSTATGTAREGSESGDIITDSDTATITRTLLTIVKEGPETASVGDTVSYTFTITNSSAAPISIDRISDQLPQQFSFTGVTLVIDGVNVPLEEGEDYTVSANGLFVLTPSFTAFIPAGDTAILNITGVITA